MNKILKIIVLIMLIFLVLITNTVYAGKGSLEKQREVFERYQLDVDDVIGRIKLDFNSDGDYVECSEADGLIQEKMLHAWIIMQDCEDFLREGRNSRCLDRILLQLSIALKPFRERLRVLVPSAIVDLDN